MEEKLTVNRPPQSEEEVSFVKDTTRTTQTFTYMYVVMVVLMQNLARVCTPTHVKNLERNGHIKKALAQHKNARVENVETNHFAKMCRTVVILKQGTRQQYKKSSLSMKRLSQAAVMMNIRLDWQQQIQNACENQRCQKQKDH